MARKTRGQGAMKSAYKANGKNNDDRLGAKPWKCRLCPKSFLMSSSLITHKQYHPRLVTHWCWICKQTFATRPGLKDHQAKAHASQSNGLASNAMCSICLKDCRNNYKRICHEYSHSREGTINSSHKSSLSNDVLKPRNKTGEDKQYCGICNKSFHAKGYLLNHMKLHSGVKPHVCQVCGKAFALKRYLVTHSWNHRANQPCFSCVHCDKNFPTNARLQRHMKIHNKLRLYPCKICSMSFTDSKSLEVHKRVHTGERPFSCSLCPKTFIRKNHLNAHMQFHQQSKTPVENRPRPYACEICGKSYMKRSHLKEHNKLHASENEDAGKDRNFKCEECGKSYIRRNHLRDHYRLKHKLTELPETANDVESRSHICDLCGKAYLRRNHLIEHKRMQHPPLEVVLNPYTCPHCQKNWVTKGQLRRHMKTHTKHSQSVKKDHEDVNGEKETVTNAINGEQPSNSASDIRERESNFEFGQGTLDSVEVEVLVKRHCVFCGKVFDSLEACSEHEIVHLQEEKNKIDGRILNMKGFRCNGVDLLQEIRH